uniref:Peptidase M48 domain-containing protein n=1 Tax=Dunaliella tertiolecta TaxID=3047 RepID=A0A7S3VQ66_DUNTE
MLFCLHQIAPCATYTCIFPCSRTPCARHSMMFVSKQREKELGTAMFDMQRREAAMKNTLLPSHHPYVAAVKRAGMRVAEVAADGSGGGVFEHMKDVQWEFAVISSPVPNAFVVPGGKVVVYTGLLELLGSEEELAAVLAHETGHVLARHHAERLSSFNLWGIIKVLSWMLFGIGLPNAAFALGIFLPYSRRAEHEADAIGLQLMARACFDPKACTTMLQKLHGQEKKQPLATATPAFLRTHPLTNERVQRVKDALPQAYKTYQDSGCGQAVGFLRGVVPESEFLFVED